MKPYEKTEITKESFASVLKRFPERAKELDRDLAYYLLRHHHNYIDYQYLNDAVKTDLGICKLALNHMNVDRLHAGIYGDNNAMLALFYEFQDKYEGREILEELLGERRAKIFPDRRLSVDDAIVLHKRITKDFLDDESRYDRDLYYEHQRVLMSGFCNDEKFIYATVEHFGSNIDRNVPDWMKADKELALKAIESNAGLYTILHHFDPEIQLDREVALFAASRNIQEKLPYKFRDDPIFVEVIIEERLKNTGEFLREDLDKHDVMFKDSAIRNIFRTIASKRIQDMVGAVQNPLQALSLMRMKKELESDLDDTKKPAKKHKL